MKDLAKIVHIVSSHQEVQALKAKLPQNSSPTILDLTNLNTNPLHIDSNKKDQIDQQYLEFIGQLSSFFPSEFWWAGSVSEKNEFLSKFYNRFFVLIALGEWFKKSKHNSVIIVCPDQPLVSQIKGAFNSKFKIEAYGQGKFVFKLKVRNFLRYICKVCLLFIREVKRMLINKSILKERFKQVQQKKNLVTIKAWVDHRNFKSGEYKDPYFGGLPDFLQKENFDYVLLMDILSGYQKNLEMIRDDKKHCMITLDYFISISALFQALLTSIRERFVIKKPLTWQELDLSELVKYENEESFYSTQFLENILYFYKMRNFLKVVHANVYIQIFENYSWEKMCLLAIQKSNQKIKTIGFQHAFISKNSFRYFLGKNDVPKVPKPDKILTMGQVTRRILTSYGHWPKERISLGCALRQQEAMKLKEQSRSQSRNVLVCFTMSPETTAKMIQFLHDAQLGEYPHSVILRLHPLTELEDVKKRLSFEFPKNFIVSKGKTVFEDFERSGVVLYSQTTMALEALKYGLPIIYLDIHQPFYLDPLFECQEMKDSVFDPKKLVAQIDNLLDMSSSQYQEQTKKAHKYIDEYFAPITDEALSQFVN